jgi:hypothetical protein
MALLKEGHFGRTIFKAGQLCGLLPKHFELDLERLLHDGARLVLYGVKSPSQLAQKSILPIHHLWSIPSQTFIPSSCIRSTTSRRTWGGCL